MLGSRPRPRPPSVRPALPVKRGNNMNHPRHLLRSMLRETFRSSSEFEAFCIDRFEGVSQALANGMDRVAQENLLLTMVDTKEIFEAINEHKNHPEAEKSRFKHLDSIEQYIALLKQRARRIILIFQYHSDKTTALLMEKFVELHNQHINYISQQQFMLAHEILREITEILRSLEQRRPKRRLKASILEGPVLYDSLGSILGSSDDESQQEVYLGLTAGLYDSIHGEYVQYSQIASDQDLRVACAEGLYAYIFSQLPLTKKSG